MMTVPQECFLILLWEPPGDRWVIAEQHTHNNEADARAQCEFYKEDLGPHHARLVDTSKL